MNNIKTIKKIMISPLFYGLLTISCLTVVSIVGCRSKGSFYKIDGKKAFEQVKRLVEFGPHPSGSQAINNAQEYIKKYLSQVGTKVTEQEFIAYTPMGNIPMKNIIGILPGKTEEIIILATHYETKYFTEFEFVGANDGCSGTGLLLELARVFSKEKEDRAYTLWFVFFDGEEAFLQWTPADSLYGSRYFISEQSKQNLLSKIRALILLDMVGDKDLIICKEDLSTGWLQDIVWSKALEMNYQEYFQECHQQVIDDHLPFLKAGIPAINLIDFQYGGSASPGSYWHTDQDTLDKISPQSLQVVGEVVYHSVFLIEEELSAKKRTD